MKSRQVKSSSPMFPLAFLLLVFFAGGVFPAVAAEEEATRPKDSGKLRFGTVTAGTLNVRARPARHFERIGTFSRGDRVTIVSENENWFEVRVPKNTRAWIASRFVDRDGLVTSDNLRIHSGPGLVFTTFGRLRRGERVAVTGPPVDGWIQIEVPETVTAWVNKAYVRVDEPEPPAPNPETAATPANAKPAGEKALPSTTNKTAAKTAENQAETEQKATAQNKPPKHTTGSTPKTEDEIELPSKDWKKITLLPREKKKAAKKGSTPEAETADLPDAKTKAADTAIVTKPAPGKSSTESGVTKEAEAKAADAGEKTEVVVTKEATQITATEQAEAQKQESAEPANEENAETTQEQDQTKVTEPKAETEEAEEALKKGASPLVMREGLLLSLKDQASPQATHVLCLRVHYTAFPLCYLRSEKIDLKEWERREVRVYGRQFLYEGWEKPVIDVTGIQLRPKE